MLWSQQCKTNKNYNEKYLQGNSLSSGWVLLLWMVFNFFFLYFKLFYYSRLKWYKNVCYIFSFFMYNSKKKSVMVIIQEADVITTWVKARNRKDWGKIKSCCKYQKPMPVCQLLVKEPTVWHICYVDRAVIYTFP